MTDKKKTIEELEGFELVARDLIYGAYQQGKSDGQGEKAQAQWVVEEIKIAYEKGFKEGQTSALKSIEGSNQKIYEG